MKYEDFDKRDTCLQVSHYIWAKSVLNETTLEDLNILGEMLDVECRLSSPKGHRKNRTYFWSNSDGLTRWLHDKILKYLDLDVYKGLNGDQYRAYFIWLYSDYIAGDRLIENVINGYIRRLGFAPSLMEHCIFKPQAYVLLLKRTKYYKFNPLYWISRAAFHFSMKRNLKQPIKGHTTNKISLLPTMHYLGYDLPDKSYTDAVYNRYYKNGTELCELMKKAIDKLRKVC